MYEDKSKNNSELRLFGLKIYEEIRESTTIFEHEFQSDEEEQTFLADREIITRKFLGIPFIKAKSEYDPQHLLPVEPKAKITLPPINKIGKLSLIILTMIVAAGLLFGAGIYTANTHWFNDTFYIKSRQMENLNIKSLKPYDKALFNDANSQYEMNEASSKRYEHYHEYYDKVVERISKLGLDEKEAAALSSYIDGYEERKANFDYVMFPHKNDSIENGGYGTILGSAYPKAMMEFDRQELLTYRMILLNMYAYISTEEINVIFEE